MFCSKSKKSNRLDYSILGNNVDSYPLHQWVSDYRHFLNERENSEEDISEWLMMHFPPFGTENKAIPKLFKYWHGYLLPEICKHKHLKRISCTNKDCIKSRNLIRCFCS